MSEENGAAKGQQQKQSSNKQKICRDFQWGKCKKFTKCKFRHELDYEEMKRILIFCHNFQNNQNCKMTNCSYLHASKEEEEQFKNFKKLPQVLVERHALLAAASFRADTMGMAPPLPPPAVDPRLNQPGQSVQLSTTSTFDARVILQPPPPPPPPPPPETQLLPAAVQMAPVSNYQIQLGYPGDANQPLHASTYPSPNNAIPINTSIPPPPFVGQTSCESATLKRNNQLDLNFGPAKMARSSTMCESCVELEKRLEESKLAYDEAMSVEADLHLAYKKQLESYESLKKEFYLKLSNLRMQHKIDDILENIDLSTPGTSNSTSNENLTMAMLKTLLTCVLETSDETISPVSIKEDAAKLQMIPGFEPSVPPPAWVPTLNNGYPTSPASQQTQMFSSHPYQVISPSTMNNNSQMYNSYYTKYK